MKFKVGDKVKVVKYHTYTRHVSKIGVIKFTFPELKGYSVRFKEGGVGGFVEDELKLATIHNSKLARNLYKNQIDYIDEETQLIYLK